MENGEKAVVFSPGVIISITDVKGTIEVAADRVVLWTRGDIRDLVEPGHADQARPGRGLEFYLSGNVEIHNVNVKDAQELRCNEAYYDVSRSVAIALDADFAIQQPGLPDKVHVFTPELHQLNAKLFEVSKSMVNASKLPYGPGLALSTGYATLEERRVEKTTIFGTTFFKRDTGELEYEDQRIFTGYNVVTELEGIPIFYLPYLQGDANDPLGPLQSAGIGYSKAFGFQLFTTFNIYDLVGIDPVPGTHWRLLADYLSSRGPAIGTDYNAVGKDFFGIKGKFETNVLGYLIDDHGTDLLGGDRGTQTVVGYPGPATVIPITHPELRGRLLANINAQELPYSLTFQGQVAAISDRNFEEQYFNKEWINGPNLETFAYLKQQENNWNWSILAEQRIRNWVTETDWLPKVEGHWIGQDFLDVFSNNVRASAGWAHLEPTHQPPPAFEPTDVNVETGRFEVMDELSLPFYAGPFKLVPYIVGEAAYYTEDITGVDRGRLYYGGGIRGSIPFSRLYPDVESELFNLNGLYHKIVASANYYWAHSSASMYNYPQLDRLNDDVSDQALRDIRPYQPGFNPSNAAMLNSGFFDPQFFALRKLVMSRVDTLDSIEVVELDLRQRLQTKRGFYGMQHIIDWMTLDVKASFFPQPNTQNFGEVVNFVEYDWNWNIGDRTSLFSSGWFDPHEGGGRAWNVGAQINRPDSTSLLLAYRQIDPLESKQVSAAITLPFSAKYSLTASTAYDFGVHNQINALSITRAGTDLQISLGVTYNSINNNFGFIFEIYPNLLPANKRVAGLSNLLASGR